LFLAVGRREKEEMQSTFVGGKRVDPIQIRPVGRVHLRPTRADCPPGRSGLSAVHSVKFSPSVKIPAEGLRLTRSTVRGRSARIGRTVGYDHKNSSSKTFEIFDSVSTCSFFSHSNPLT
jgi:hypothetical protein